MAARPQPPRAPHHSLPPHAYITTQHPPQPISTTSSIRRNLFSNSNTSTLQLPSQPAQPSAPARRPPSRPISRSSTRTQTIPPQTTSSETLRMYTQHGAPRPQSRPIRPRSRGLVNFGLDGANDDRGDVGMYDESGAQEGVAPEAAVEEAQEEAQEEEDEGILVEEDQQAPDPMHMAKQEMEQLLALAMQGLAEDEEAEGEGNGQGGGDAGRGGFRITSEMIEGYRAGRGRMMDEADFVQLVKGSLREKVASLEDDKWMYEEEKEEEDEI